MNHLRALVLCALAMLCSHPSDAVIPPTRPIQTIGDSIGVQIKPELTTDDDLRLIALSGFHYVRFDMRWREVEYAHGSYDWSRFDSLMERIAHHQLRPIIILGSGHPLYGSMVDIPPEHTPTNYSKAYSAPKESAHFDGFSAFARAAAQHYSSYDPIWELWNEPDHTAFWAPKPKPKDYARLAGDACFAMRSVAPSAYIIAPSVSRFPSADEPESADFMKAFLTSRAVTCVNGLSFHPYRHHTIPETVADDYRTKLRPLIEPYAATHRLDWISSEWGYNSIRNSSQQQGMYMVRSLLINLLEGVRTSIWYEWKDSSHTTNSDANREETHYGIVEAWGTPKPSMQAMLALLKQIEDAHLLGRIVVENIPQAYVVAIEFPNHTRGMIGWLETDSPERTMPVQLYYAGKDYTLPLSAFPNLTILPR